MNYVKSRVYANRMYLLPTQGVHAATKVYCVEFGPGSWYAMDILTLSWLELITSLKHVDRSAFYPMILDILKCDKVMT